MWSQPVTFEGAEAGQYITVNSPVEAIHVLDRWWVKIDGEAFRQAINTCIDATRGDASPEDARAAFISALIEGGIVIKPV